MKGLFNSWFWKPAVAFTVALLTLWVVKFLIVAGYALSTFSNYKSPVFRIILPLINETYPLGFVSLSLVLMILMAAVIDRLYFNYLTLRFREIGVKPRRSSNR